MLADIARALAQLLQVLQLKRGIVDMQVTSIWIYLPQPGKCILLQPQS